MTLAEAPSPFSRPRGRSGPGIGGRPVA